MISFVIPCFNEEDSLKALCEEIIKNISALKHEYEIIFVDDGSTDNSVNVIKHLIADNNSVRLISFRKNLGKSLALQSGFRNCNGDIIITMDADLQDDPCEINKFIEKIEEGYDLVSGWKYERHDPLEKRFPSKIFNKTVSYLSGVRLHDFNCGFKAYRREVTQNVDIYGELHRYIPVLAHRKGFRIAEIKITHNSRQYGKSKFGMERYLRGFFDSITVVFLSKYYDRPMHIFGRLGGGVSLIGVLISTYLSIEWLRGFPIGNRPLLLLGILCILLGVQLFSIGLIGDMMLDTTYRYRYDESHIREKI
ncbi:MAG: glycosyltransferase family 2 protein [Synergistaceae bacterium]|jgi:glycosyltransferase involved in cell wall biosynthesis|nr:glycosyltransferase family 2 protein [Synergistaceae bacterium]